MKKLLITMLAAMIALMPLASCGANKDDAAVDGEEPIVVDKDTYDEQMESEDAAEEEEPIVVDKEVYDEQTQAE